MKLTVFALTRTITIHSHIRTATFRTKNIIHIYIISMVVMYFIEFISDQYNLNLYFFDCYIELNVLIPKEVNFRIVGDRGCIIAMVLTRSIVD